MNDTRTLCEFEPGARVAIESYCACGKLRCRLCALGLTPGTEVVVESPGPGPCRVSVRGSSLVIGHGLADKVMAKRL